MTTIAQLKKTLTEKQIAFKSKARKAELIALLPPLPGEVVLSPLDIFFAKEVADTSQGRGINNYVYQWHGEISSGFGSACYARFNYNPGRVTGLIIDISWHFQRMSEVMKEHYPEWITGMLRDSPFSVAFREKSFEEAMKSGVHLNVGTCSASVCIAAAVALRGYHEYPRRHSTYIILRTFDIPFRTKWFLSLVLVRLAGGWAVTAVGSNHCVLGDRVEKQVLLTTLREGLKEDLIKSYAKAGGTYQLFKTVGGERNLRISEVLKSLVIPDSVVEKVDAWTHSRITIEKYSDAAIVKFSQALLSPQPA